MTDLTKYKNEDGTFTSPKNNKIYKSLKAFRSHWFYNGDIDGVTFRSRLKDVGCQHCNQEVTIGNISRHEAACASNPTVIKQKTKICPVCSTAFMKDATTCSYACSNTYFRHGQVGGLQYSSDEALLDRADYRQLCFRYHEKKCVICDEQNIVAVHHLNEDHTDNRIENLIPLCPTHHHYCHSSFHHLIRDDIAQYVAEWIRDIGDEEAGSSAAFGVQRAGFDSPVSDQ